MTHQSNTVINEHILEIRYKPNPRILDFRGTWALAISQLLEVPHWRIIENRIDIFSEDNVIRAFVGFHNSGIILLDTPTRNYFPDHAIKLLKFLFQLDGFGDPIFLERLGVRSKFCTPFQGTFEDLRDRVTVRYVSLTEQGKAAIGFDSSLIDVGAPLNFADKLGNFNTMCGPMSKDQFPRFFSSSETFPEVGLYYDIDYWSKPNKEMEGKQLLNLVRDFAYAAWDRHDRVRSLIIK